MLSHFPSPNPQEVAFALKELALDREIVPVGLARGKHRQPRFLARNPLGRVPALVGGELTLPRSHAILAYLGEKTGRLLADIGGRAPSRRSDGCSSCRGTSCRRGARWPCVFARNCSGAPSTDHEIIDSPEVPLQFRCKFPCNSAAIPLLPRIAGLTWQVVEFIIFRVGKSAFF